MRGGSKTLLAAVAALLLALGLAACGGGDDSSSTATEVATQERAEDTSGGGSASSEAAEDDSGGEESDSSEGSDSGGAAESHDDSGGGSEQFRVKGGDNSVQEFGNEADTAERDAAAAVLHTFLDARAEEDWATACAQLTRDIAESLEKLAAQAKEIDDKSCAGVLGKLTNPAAVDQIRAESVEADVGSLRFEGSRGFVIYRGAENAVLAMPMTKEGGTWKVAGLAGSPLS